MKTKFYNLLILDESGSMEPVTRQAISGCNEVLNSVKSNQEANYDSQEHFVSIYAFQSNAQIPSRYLVKNVPAAAVQHITTNDYRPWGGTPLYDAVGSCLAELKALARNSSDDILVSITIITDGYENSSRNYTLQKVAGMIKEVKEMGWNVNIIGANIDVTAAAKGMNIDTENAMEFDQTDEGTHAMFHKLNNSMAGYCCNISAEKEMPEMTAEERVQYRKKASKRFFQN